MWGLTRLFRLLQVDPGAQEIGELSRGVHERVRERIPDVADPKDTPIEDLPQARLDGEVMGGGGSVITFARTGSCNGFIWTLG